MSDPIKKIQELKEAIDALQDRTIIRIIDVNALEELIAENLKSGRSPIADALKR